MSRVQAVPDLHTGGRAGHQPGGRQPSGHLRRVVEPLARRPEHIPRLPLRAEEALLYLPLPCYGNKYCTY